MDVNALLFSLPALAPLVGRNIYAQVLPNATRTPSITYQVLARTVPGAGVSNAGLTKMRVQCDCFAPDYFAADAIREALIWSLNGYVGNVGNASVQYAQLINAPDHYEDTIEMHRLSADFYLWF